MVGHKNRKVALELTEAARYAFCYTCYPASAVAPPDPCCGDVDPAAIQSILAC